MSDEPVDLPSDRDSTPPPPRAETGAMRFADEAHRAEVERLRVALEGIEGVLGMERTDLVRERLAKLEAENARLGALVVTHLEAGPLSWENVGWNDEAHEMLRLELRETNGRLRAAMIPMEKAKTIAAIAKMAREAIALNARAAEPTS